MAQLFRNRGATSSEDSSELLEKEVSSFLRAKIYHWIAKAIIAEVLGPRSSTRLQACVKDRLATSTGHNRAAPSRNSRRL